MKYDEILAERSHKKIYRDGDKVVKVFDSNYSTSDILNEALNHARVSETDLPIPEFLDVDKTEDGWAIVTQFIEGKTLAALMEENPSKKKSYLEKFIDLQMRVHSKRAPLLNKLKDKMNRKSNSLRWTQPFGMNFTPVWSLLRNTIKFFMETLRPAILL